MNIYPGDWSADHCARTSGKGNLQSWCDQEVHSIFLHHLRGLILRGYVYLHQHLILLQLDLIVLENIEIRNSRWQHDNHERGAFVVWDVMQKEQDMVSTE